MLSKARSWRVGIRNSLLDHRRHDDAPRLRHDVVSEKTCRGETRDAWHDAARGEGAGRTARGRGSRGLCARRCPTGSARRAGGRAHAPGAAGRTSRARGTTGTGRRGRPAGPAAAPSRAGPWARSGAPSPRGTSGRAAPGTRARAGRLGSARGPAGCARARPGSCARGPARPWAAPLRRPGGDGRLLPGRRHAPRRVAGRQAARVGGGVAPGAATLSSGQAPRWKTNRV